MTPRAVNVFSLKYALMGAGEEFSKGLRTLLPLNVRGFWTLHSCSLLCKSQLRILIFHCGRREQIRDRETNREATKERNFVYVLSS